MPAVVSSTASDGLVCTSPISCDGCIRRCRTGAFRRWRANGQTLRRLSYRPDRARPCLVLRRARPHPPRPAAAGTWSRIRRPSDIRMHGGVRSAPRGLGADNRSADRNRATADRRNQRPTLLWPRDVQSGRAFPVHLRESVRRRGGRSSAYGMLPATGGGSASGPATAWVPTRFAHLVGEAHSRWPTAESELIRTPGARSSTSIRCLRHSWCSTRATATCCAPRRWAR